MKKPSYHFLRVGLAITFLWIGILIFQNPEAWGSYIRPWALQWLPLSLVQVMIGTAVLDLTVGVLLLLDVFTWVAAFVGAIHIIVVLITSGITDITVRDVGLLTGSLAISFEALPAWIVDKFKKKQVAPLTNNQ